jgi:hypothetical protein
MSTRPNDRESPQPAASDAPPTIRHDGWTRQKQGDFLAALATTHSVAEAAREVGMSRQSAYRLRARLQGEPFDFAWDAAFKSAFDRLAEAAMDRAMNGVEVQHYHKGEVVGSSRRFDERFTIALLKMRHEIGRGRGPTVWPASAYHSEDLSRLLERVEDGPETWDEEREEERLAQLAEYGEDDEMFEKSEENDGVTFDAGPKTPLNQPYGSVL